MMRRAPKLRQSQICTPNNRPYSPRSGPSLPRRTNRMPSQSSFLCNGMWALRFLICSGTTIGRFSCSSCGTLIQGGMGPTSIFAALMIQSEQPWYC